MDKIKTFFINHSWLLIIIIPIIIMSGHLISNIIENYQVNRDNRILERKNQVLERDILSREKTVELLTVQNKLLSQSISRRDSTIIINKIYTNEKIKSVDRDTPSELQEFLSNYKPLRNPEDSR